MSSTGVYPPALRIRFAKLLNARAIWVLAAFVVGIQLAVTERGGPDQAYRLYEELGLRRIDFLAGKVWQLLTYGLLHGGLLHLGMNVLCLLMLGSSVEHVVGKAGVLKVIVAGMFGGGILHLVLTPGGIDAPILVGLSGGCVALLVFLTTVSPHSRMWPLPVSGQSLGLGVLVAELLLALFDPKLGIGGFSEIGKTLTEHGLGAWFSIGHACHLGGGISGFLCGRWMLRPRVTLERLRRDRARREAKERLD